MRITLSTFLHRLNVGWSTLFLFAPLQGAVQQLYLLQCPSIPSLADQRSLQCLDIPFDCNITAANSETQAANNIGLTLQRFFAVTVGPTQPVRLRHSYSLLASVLAAAVV